MVKELNVSDLGHNGALLRAGDELLLSGIVYTARDAAHKKIFYALEHGLDLPFPIAHSVIYYTGPTPAKPGMIIGSCGPTTSSRMDYFAPKLYDMGLVATIGKGPRSVEVTKAIARNHALYLCALGGVGALAAASVSNLEVIAYDELGCESVKRLTLERFPLFVGIDSFGNSIFNIRVQYS